MDRYKGTILPFDSTIEKCGARAMLERVQGAPVEVVGFHANTEGSVEMMMEMEKERIVPIDLGDDNYKVAANNVGSATEFILKTYGPQFGYTPTAADKALVEMFNKNNAAKPEWWVFKKGGYLKSFHMAIAALTRDLHDVDGYDHVEIVDRTSHVIHAWLTFTDGEGLDPNRDDAGLSRFPDFLEKTAKCNFAPLTVGSYLKHLWRLGYSDADVREKVAWWIAGWQRIEEEKQNAREEFARREADGLLRRDEFFAGGLKWFWLETDNKFLVSAFRRNYPQVIVRSSRGHVSVMTNRLNLIDLADALLLREPGRWYNQEEAGNLINGGRIYYRGKAPTGLSRDDIARAIDANPPKRPQPSGFNRPLMVHGSRR